MRSSLPLTSQPVALLESSASQWLPRRWVAWLRTVSPRSVQSEVPFRPVLVPPRRLTNYSEESASHCGGGMQSCGSTDSPHSCPSWTGSPDLLHSLYCLPPFWGNLFLSYSIIYIYYCQKKTKKKRSTQYVVVRSST